MADPAHTAKGSTVGKFGGGLVTLAVGVLVLVFAVMFAASQITGNRMVIQVPTVNVETSPPALSPATRRVEKSFENF